VGGRGKECIRKGKGSKRGGGAKYERGWGDEEGLAVGT